jgi:thiamine biosynthesis lipoprotein
MPQISESSFVASRLRVGLGTFVAVDAQAATADIAESGIAAAYDAVALVEKLMHPARAGSDLAAIRDGAPGTPLRIHAWTWDVLELSQRMNRLSQGIFDPCMPESAGRLPDLELTGSQCVIQHVPLCIDLGGIAKGYAVDRAIDALRAAGCDGGLVNAGGDLAVFGAGSHEVFCRDRRGFATMIELRDRALATSEVASESRPVEHRGYYHGANRRPVTSGKVAITAASAAIADALTKCLLPDDRGSSRALLKAFDARRIDF